MKRFRNFMDKIDSHKFKMSLDNEFEADENRDIDEIKDIKRLKDLLSKLKSFLKFRKLLVRCRRAGQPPPKGDQQICED